MTPRRAIAGAALLAALGVAIASRTAGPALAASKEPPDPPRAPARLADTGLYAAGSTDVIDPRNRAYAPQYPLWSDGLVKRRWVHLPPDAAIDASNEHAWDFPAGTRFWKEFSLGGRKVETRLLWKASAAGWVFATYVWNESGTDAVLAPDDGVPGAVEVAPGRSHGIPGRTDCAACHGSSKPRPLGFNALQLSTDRDPSAIHGEPLGPGMLSLRDLAKSGALAPARDDLLANPPRIRTAKASTRAVLGYLAANCGVCHDGSGEIAALGPIIRHEDLLKDGDAVARSLFGHQTSWHIPGAPEGTSVLVYPGAPEKSALFLRMRSRSPSTQMPPLGTVVRDRQAVEAIRKWIAIELARSH